MPATHLSAFTCGSLRRSRREAHQADRWRSDPLVACALQISSLSPPPRARTIVRRRQTRPTRPRWRLAAVFALNTQLYYQIAGQVAARSGGARMNTRASHDLLLCSPLPGTDGAAASAPRRGKACAHRALTAWRRLVASRHPRTPRRLRHGSNAGCRLNAAAPGLRSDSS